MPHNLATNLMCSDPSALYLNEENRLMEKEGCAVCLFRNKKHVFGDKSLCDDLTRQPIEGECYCDQWTYDEGCG